MVFDRRMGDSRDRGGPVRNSRYSDRGSRLVPYQPKRIKGSPSKRCYVNNLPYDIKWQHFKDHMKQAGTVSFVELFEDRDGKSLGCGLVEYSSSEEVEKAIDTLNNSKLNGREIKVKTDELRFYPKVPESDNEPLPPPHGGHDHHHHMDRRPPSPGPMGGGGGGGPPPYNSRSSHPPVSNVVFVSNLAYDLSPRHIREAFESCGEVLKVNIERDREGKSKGFGTVVFKYPDMAMRAIDEFDGRNLKGRKVNVRMDKLTSVHVGGGPGQGPPPDRMEPHHPPPGHGGGGGGGVGGGPLNLHSLGLPGNSTQQSQLLQSIGLAAITSMLGNGDRGQGSALENLLGRDTIEGLIRTQNVGGSSSGGASHGGGGGGGGQGYSSQPYDRGDRDYREKDDRRSYDSFNDSGYMPPPERRHESMERYPPPERGPPKYREPANKIFVRNIPYTLGNQQLRDFFRHAGHIDDCNIMTDSRGNSRGCAVVRFESPADADRAVNMFHRSHLQGREIEVRIDN